MPGAPRAVAARVKRREDPRLLRGRGRFVDDVVLPGLAHAAFARSAFAHARLVAVDTGAARRAPGVLAVLTGEDLAALLAPLIPRLDAPGFVPTPGPHVPRDRASFVGEPIAIVVADSAYAAADAAEQVRVQYEPLPAVADISAALAPDAPRLVPGAPTNELFTHRHCRGDVDGAFASAPVVVRESFRHARVSPAPLEGRGLVARWDGDALTVWAGSQVPHILRTALARAFRLPEHQVRVEVPDTGGGFGQKMQIMAEDLAVAAAARAVGRPVKWIETRRENLAAASQAREARVDVEAAASEAGVLLALRVRVWSDAGCRHGYPLTASLEAMGTASILPGPYRTPAYASEVVAVATNKPPLGAYRGVGMAMGAFAMERTMDLLAARLGMDPAEIRRRNLIAPGEYPFESAGGFRYDSGDLPRALDRALDLSGYDRLVDECLRGRQRGRLMGVGLACYTEYTGMGSRTYRQRGMADVPGPEGAVVGMDEEGRVTVRVSFPSQGQGHATTIAQLVSGELGIPLEAITVVPVDTAASPPGTGTFASRGAVVQGGAVAGAAREIRRRLLAQAADALEASEADLEIGGGRIWVRGLPERGMPVREVARRAHRAARPSAGEPPLGATVAFDPPGPTFSGAVHVAAVEVEPDTGRVAVRAYTVVEDCGPVVNPMIVEGQVHGAVAQGIGEALGERLVYDADAQLVTGTLMDYALPVASALPFVTVGHVETPAPAIPGGYKGMGEGGTIGAPAAIANAVADAVRPAGIAVTSLPILPDTLVVPRRVGAPPEATER